MGRFRNILVAAAPGHLEVPVLKRAAKLAGSSGADLTVLDVVEPISPSRRTVSVAGRVVDVQALLIDERRRNLTAALAAAGLDHAAAEVVCGKPAIEVTRFAMDNDCDLVIVGEAAARTGETRIVAPEVTQLVRLCPTPVWVMCSSRARRLRVLALVDPDPADSDRDSLNDRILELATSITQSERAELHVAHAWQLAGESAMRSSPFINIASAEVDLILQAARDEHRAQLEDLAERHGVAAIGGRTHLLKGLPADVLPPLADRLQINLLVMGTVARRGLRGLIMGNTAEAMMRAVRCSILTVKPDGWVSPVAASAGDAASR